MSDPSKTVVVAGSPRSGTTLILDILASSLKYRKIFEPLHPKRGPGAEGFYYTYIRSEEKNPQIEDFMRKVLVGKISTTWTNDMGSINDVKSFIRVISKIHRWRWWAPNKVMKIIRGNLMLGWLERTFGCKIVFIVRHPCAVVESQKRMGWERGREEELRRVLSQEDLFEDYLKPYEDEILRIQKKGDYWEKSALLWAIENMVPMKQIERGELHALPVFYENLVMEPEKEIKRISEYTGIKEANIRMMDIPSRTADKTQFYKSKEKMLSKWKARLSKEEIEKILNTIKLLDTDYYGNDVFPVKLKTKILKRRVVI